MLKSIPCTIMRGGTSKGAYFLQSDLPKDELERDKILLQVMGSPDERQIDGIGGANPLTSKIAIINESDRSDADIDYLFGQVAVDQAIVGYTQNCGNILAGVGQFAIERGLLEPSEPTTNVRVHMVNSGDIAVATIATPGGQVVYDGDTKIDGVPGNSAPVLLNFLNTSGSLCGALFPTGNRTDIIDNVELTCIDNGMPIVLMRASDFNVTGLETVTQLEGNHKLKERLENIRLKVGPMMNLGDVVDKTVPKMTLLSQSNNKGLISTRSFIPHRCHSAIGVLAAVTVATACLIPGTCAEKISGDVGMSASRFLVEHPSGGMEVDIELELEDGEINIKRSGFIRTARKICEGQVFVTMEES
ncbi:MAG: 4-oxalomesaconate tautomerase [Pseudomonadota bacterium]|nr:4-oxalomesaconate tautomerase [Pseudomonadota bacterium]